MNFEQFSLDPRINAGIKNAGYTTPTPIQQQAIPVVLEGHDILGLAQTGTGKTAAFMLPILQRLTKGPLRKVRVLIVAPTRELAEQIAQTSVTLSKQMKISTVTVYGGVGKMPQVNALRRGAEIVVACPGRLLDLIGEGQIDLSGVEVLVLDEADHMCDMGFLPDIRRILKHVPAKRQTLFFSATMPDDIRGLASDILKHPVTVQIGMIAPAETVSHALYPVPDGLKTKLLLTMLQQSEIERALIFTRTKRRARSLAETLGKSGYRVSALQGNMAQNRRQEAINGFRSGEYDILVATDIAARGIDVASVSHVINYDMPDTVDAYTHRIGRTGRAQLTGEAFTFTEHDDEPMVRAIERVLGSPVERRKVDGFDYGGAFVQTRPASQGYASRQPQSSRNGGQNSSRAPQNGSTRAGAVTETTTPESKPAKSRRRRPYWRQQGTQA
ncbi:DEAD/DEAH box helicase [Caldilinea sp.]|uniref:DEAD/DEAH box helicase n=1 Tax=Caldilinea sp. TaxID=2293560 RepID=UPI002CCD7E5E|nr:DEAD/DEAH box helicase [Anaerolineales bacterium]HQY92650.1 DEAD/DEAH box helicase [Caldilinea sp.]HRA64748.1 DEAD/DEAH box helicase [Caldilinea sp.]